jgi:hypothetical protein
MPEPSVDWASARPAAPLRPFVDRYVGYRLAGFAPGVHRGLPSRHMTLIVSIGEAIDVVEQTDPRQGPQRYGCVLGGLQAAPASIAVPDVGESSDDGSANTAMKNLPLRRVFYDSVELLLHRSDEFMTETGELNLVVVECLRDIGFGFTRQLGVPFHARRRIRSLTSDQGEAASGSRR